MATISGVLETSLYVEDLNRAVNFYDSLFQFEKLNEDDRFCAFNVAGQQVLLLFARGASVEPMEISGGVIPPHDGSGNLHLAFSIPASDLAPWEERLSQLRIPVESRVRWPRGGTSLYFRDPDGHAVELVTPGCWAIY